MEPIRLELPTGLDVGPVNVYLFRQPEPVLVDAVGKPLPLGSLVRVQGSDGLQPVLVGFDGETYVDTLNLQNVLDVQTPAGTCRVSFDYPKQGKGIAQIGPLQCFTESAR